MVMLGESWLGRQDSNLGMSVPKTDALPLGDAPTAAVFSRWHARLQGGSDGFCKPLFAAAFRVRGAG
jgi:hypothetical protein